ncbi:MAG TPA: A/G-specific adenine glycosylase [Burkholderiaceae bacterium]|nr:A/G-specific adenine glycosylase [Burkholderiaceae bacterium]
MKSLPVIAEAVVDWQRVHGRHGLPWHGSRDPYRVWLSEIMLQQTQVATVLAYYQRFLEHFPDVGALAAASQDQVLALWSGLGYYSRARNLHRCAIAVVEQHGGRFPGSAEQLAQLPGIGRSTAAAIAAFCFNQRVAILDGNVKRVLARVLAFGADLASAREERRLWALATQLLPEREADMAAYTQGLMDLGATVCLARAPVCTVCPLQGTCAAQRRSTVQDYPVKSRRTRRTKRENWWLWLQWRGQVWLQQRPQTGVWAGLWTVPLLSDEEALHQALGRLGVAGTELPVIEHALTHFDWTLRPWLARFSKRPPEAAMAALGAGRWVALRDLDSVALPAPLGKLLRSAATAVAVPA